jgi:serine/threonine-protein kinase ULK/ATG1
MSFPQDQQYQEQRVKVVAGYALQQRLGSGSFATVYKGIRVKQQQQQEQTGFDDDENDSSSSSTQRQDKQEQKEKPSTVAIKAIARTSEKLTKKVLQNLEIEISILRTYRHPNIVCMHDVQKTDRHFYLLLEYCGGGDVQHLIRSRQKGRLSERLTRRLMRDLASGLRFLWGQELIHRDIKPQNLLLTGPLPMEELAENPPIVSKSGNNNSNSRSIHDDPNRGFSLKIADFGFARHLQTASLAETLCGSPLYMAPEILQHHR